MTTTGAARPGSAALERYEAVIGVEVHCQLRTASKMFCSCSTAYDGARPNSHVCPVCLGLPGALPVINRRAVELVLAAGAAIGAETPDATRWDRKNYFYPDLPKGYQISQYDLPLASAGALTFDTSDGPVTVRITRAHLEEDTAKLIHRNAARASSGEGGEVSLVVGSLVLVGPADGSDFGSTIVHVTAPAALPYAISLNYGLHTGYPPGSRGLLGDSRVPYYLTKDPAHSQLWGDGSFPGLDTPVAGVGTGSDQGYTVYAAAFIQDRGAVALPGGTYTDVVTVAVDF